MQTPLELIFHEVRRSPWSEGLIRERVARLERFSNDIVSCHVSVSQPHRHQHKGKPYRVLIEVRLPHKRLAVTEEPVVVEREANLRASIDAPFESMERRLRSGSAAPRLRESLAPAPDEWRGLVIRLFEDQGYGFLRTPDGQEFYFHAHSVLHGGFERLAIGTEVRFEPSEGEAGPQASTVQIVNKPGERESARTRERADIPPGWRNTPD